MEPAIDSKIAFCVSGQIRGPKSALWDIAELAAKVGADVFLSVWQKRGRKTFVGATNPHQLTRIMGEVPAQMMPSGFYNRMHTIFPDVERRLAAISADVHDDLAEIFPNAVTDIEIPILNLDLDAQPNDGNSLRMLYKIWRCNRLKQSAEAARGHKYETVARFRPDVLPDVEAYQEIDWGPNCVVFPDRGHWERRLKDIFWISDSKADDYLSSLFGSAVLAPHRRWRDIHRELYEHAIAGEFQLNYLAPKKHIRETSEEDRAAARDLVSAALIQKNCILPEAFSAKSAELLGRLMQLQAMPSDRLDAFDAFVEISKSSDDIPILRAALVAAVDRRSNAPDRDLCVCILAAAVLLAIECNAIADDSRQIPSLSSFLKAWKKPLSAIDDVPSNLDLGSGKERADDALLQLATHAYDMACQRTGRDAVSEAFDSLVAQVKTHDSIMVQRVRRLFDSDRMGEALSLAEAAADRFPEDWRMFDVLSLCREGVGDASGALADTRRALELNPDNWRPWARLGKLELASGKTREAAAALRKSTSLGAPKLVYNLLRSIEG